ncbi:uncharacterized protein LOC131619413 [Vicia villosa]|uniref:uncharacterized protein LOC131619413 n=1 Tax=Vicia villosa TaxID=3911 RepID=UPI00273B3F18|nr:uncharacterized protein LOC131619413 [Vicia villosa]
MTNLSHFNLIKIRYPLQKLAEICISVIVKLHGISPSIISDRDQRFTSRIWESLQEFLGTKLSIFYASKLWKYIPDPSYVIPLDDVQVRDNLSVETSPLQIEDQEVKHLRGKEISLVKVMSGGCGGGRLMLELESKMKGLYPELFP